MHDRSSKTSRLRELLHSAETVLMPFGALPVHAQMAERAGFPAFWMSGAQSAWWSGGVSDVGLLSMTEVVNLAKSVASSVDIPIFCDADTGYGSAINARRTIQEFIQAGVAGVHIEDQEEPKKAGGQAGIRVVSDAEAIGRFQAAVDARDELDPDFVVVARTDAYGAEGGTLDEAIRRAVLYKHETGVDAIFFEGLDSWDDVRTAVAATPGPAFAIASRRAGRIPSRAELSAMGQSFQIARFALPGVLEVWKLLLDIRDSGELAASDDYTDRALALSDDERYVGIGDVFARPNYGEVRAMEEKYYPPERRRTYES